MNLLSLSSENYAENARRIKLATYIRVSSSMPELCKGQDIDFTELDKILALCKYKTLVIPLVAQFPNSKLIRSFYPGDKDQLWRDQVVADPLGYDWSWKSPKGLPDWLIAPSLALFRQFVRRCPANTIFSPDNEPGDTEDGRRGVWRGDPGEVDPRFQKYSLELCSIVKEEGRMLATTPAETQDFPTLIRQLDFCTGAQLAFADYQSTNWYLTLWQKGDTPDTFAIRFWADIKRFFDWNKLPLLVSEWFPYGCPGELVEQTVTAVKAKKPSTCRAALFYDVR